MNMGGLHSAQNSQQRLQELATITATSIHGQVYALQKPDYGRDVTEASRAAYVLVLLTSSLGTNAESGLLEQIWRELAQRYGDVKFCQMRADLCIEGYPDKNTPTVLVYKDGDIKRQLVTLKELRGEATAVGDLERLLVELGAVKQNDPRLKRTREDDEGPARRSGNRNATVDDDDSDWE